jgi:hypothetical protein
MLSRSCVHDRLLSRSVWSGGRCLVSHAAFVSEHEHARIERRRYSASSFARSNQCMFGFEESGADTGTRRNVRSTPETGHRHRPTPITCPSRYGRSETSRRPTHVDPKRPDRVLQSGLGNPRKQPYTRQVQRCAVTRAARMINACQCPAPDALNVVQPVRWHCVRSASANSCSSPAILI